jgi:hypothetical protein
MKIQHAPPKLRKLNFQYRSVTSTKNGILKTYTRIHTTKWQTQINVYPISNLQDNSPPLTSTPFMCNGMYLSSTSNSTSLELSVPFHGSAKTAVSEHFSPLGNVFTHAHQLIISYQRPTSEAPQSIFRGKCRVRTEQTPQMHSVKTNKKSMRTIPRNIITTARKSRIHKRN